MGIVRSLKSRVDSALIAVQDGASSLSQHNILLTQLISFLEETERQRANDAILVAEREQQRASDAILAADERERQRANDANMASEKMMLKISSFSNELTTLMADAVRDLATTRADIRNGTRRLSIAFFMQSAAGWPSWKTLWEACVNDPRIDPVMVLTPACYPDRELGWLDETRSFLIKEGIGFISADAFTLDRFKPHVAILQLPYTDTLPTHLDLPQLEAANVRTVYIPYGLETGGGGLNYRYQYDLPAQRTAWRIFARSENQKRMYAKYCRSGSGHVVVTGHPKLDLSFTKYAGVVANEALLKQINGRKAVLWNPHFSVQDPPLWSTFDLFKDDMIAAFAKRPDLFFIIRPHPLLFAGLIRNGFWTVEDEAAFRASIAGMENCTLDESYDYQTAFALSDVIMTDIGSFLLEFYSTGKPVLSLLNPAGYGLNDDASTMEGAYKATTSEEIETFLDMIQANEDPKKTEREQAIERFFYSLDGHAGERIRDHIYDAFIHESAGTPIDIDAGLQELPASYHQHMSDEQREAISAHVTQLLDKIDPVSSALHIGCADGRLTKAISRHTRRIHGIDADPALIAQAQANAASWNWDGKTSFSVEYLDYIASCGVYDLVVCMDVLSSVKSHYSVLRYVDIIVAMMREGAHLIVGDRLTQGQACNQTEEGHTICQRNEQQYIMMFKRRGLILVDALVEAQEEDCKRHFYVFRKEPS